jgi:hypothetical protein
MPKAEVKLVAFLLLIGISVLRQVILTNFSLSRTFYILSSPSLTVMILFDAV